MNNSDLTEAGAPTPRGSGTPTEIEIHVPRCRFKFQPLLAQVMANTLISLPGSIRAEHQPDGGACFCFTLPREEEGEAAMETQHLPIFT